MEKQLEHEFDLLTESAGLELFAEELPAQQQRHKFLDDTLSTLGCECELSTFACLSGTFAA